MEHTGLLTTIVVLAVFSVLLSGITLLSLPAGVDNDKIVSDISAQIKIPVPVIQIVNLTSIEQGIADLKANQNKDDNWKSLAKDMANEEWSKNKNKEIFKFLDSEFGNIVDRDDISSVVIRDEEVISFDVEDKDAVVSQEVKVRYEDDTGETIKKYLEITTTIKDGEIDSQDIEEA